MTGNSSKGAAGGRPRLFGGDEEPDLAALVGPVSRPAPPPAEQVRAVAEASGFPSREPTPPMPAVSAPGTAGACGASRVARMTIRFGPDDKHALRDLRREALQQAIDVTHNDIVVAGVRALRELPAARRLDILRAIAEHPSR